MDVIHLDQKITDITNAGQKWFDKIIALPVEVRQDTKSRTGLQIFARGVDVANFAIVQIRNPSLDDQVEAIEQAVVARRLISDYSKNNASIKAMELRDNVMARFDDVVIQVSVAGLQSDENVLVGVAVLADIFKKTIPEICLNIDFYRGRLPAFTNQRHYLYSLVF
ncbi:TPA: hypothetical protein DCZ15_03250 [Candidatus Falkowbacteria bacterium]|nr:MAG: hypothetical protein UV95_C0002G0037 [Candidatus Falkowbacteria bacterium GW2011_GWF2_43_32]HBA36866.1 hypothetical protein [Candidatus Falkowbacteria bacterium]